MTGPGLSAALVVLAAFGTGCNLADTFLLWPQKPQPAVRARREQIATPGGPLEVLVTGPAEPVGFVLRFYGNADVADAWVDHDATLYGALSLEVWGVNYPGYGCSAGPATLRRVAAAALSAYDALARRAAGRPIIVVGTSLGGVAALRVAAEREVALAVLHNPPPLRQLIRRRHGWWNLWLLALPTAAQVPDELDSLRNAARARAPALFLTSSDDGVVPMRYQQRVMKAYGGPWEMLEMRGAGHSDPVPAWVHDRVNLAIAARLAAMR